jgi:hypothetical protein
VFPLPGSLSSLTTQARFDDSVGGNAAIEVQGTSPDNAPDDAMEGDDQDHKMEEVDDNQIISSQPSKNPPPKLP